MVVQKNLLWCRSKVSWNSTGTMEHKCRKKNGRFMHDISPKYTEKKSVIVYLKQVDYSLIVITPVYLCESWGIMHHLFKARFSWVCVISYLLATNRIEGERNPPLWLSFLQAVEEAVPFEVTSLKGKLSMSQIKFNQTSKRSFKIFTFDVSVRGTFSEKIMKGHVFWMEKYHHTRFLWTDFNSTKEKIKIDGWRTNGHEPSFSKWKSSS